MKIINKWKDEADDFANDCNYNYITVELNENERCDIHLANNDGYTYVVNAPGGEVYYTYDVENGHRDLTDEERDAVLNIGMKEFM